MKRKDFSFGIELQQAYKSPEGKMHVVGIASDDEIDRTGDRMSDKAVRSMAEQANTGKLPLLDNHRATFGFGHSHTAEAKKTGKTTQLVVDFELDEKYPQAIDLFNEVHSGKAQKQLSIGGFLNLENPKAVRFEETGQGDKKRLVRVIDDIMLEHVATTRPNQAAVPRTKFVSAVVKDVFACDTDLPEAWRLPACNDSLVTHERGVIAAMGALLGARGESNIPADDKQGVYNHLARHYREMDREPPEFREYNENDFVKHHLDQGIDLRKDWIEENQNMAEKKQDQPQVDAAATKGLDVLARIGKAFEPTEEKIPEEVEGLVKAWDATKGKTLTEKSTAVLRKLLQSMQKILSEDGQEKPATEQAQKGLVDQAAIEKTVLAAAEKVLTEKNAKVIEAFEKSFTGLTETLAKSLGEMAGGFKNLVEKEIQGMTGKVEALGKDTGARLEKLEKAAGVRQSAPSQDAAAIKGEQTEKSAQTNGEVNKSRKADESNPWRGMFDRARNQYLARQR